MAENGQQWPLNIPWRLRLLLHFITFISRVIRRSDGSINRRLINFIDLKTPPSNEPINGVKSQDIIVDKARDLWFRLFTPAIERSSANSLPVLLFFHGGGFSLVQANSIPFDDFCRQLSVKVQTFVISVNYRLAPENRYPAAVDDCFDTLKFIDSANIDGFSNKADFRRCFMAGDSAGGNLVHHVAVNAGQYEFSKVNLIGNILIQPMFGGEERTESELSLTRAPLISVKVTDQIWKGFLPEGSNRDHLAANVFGPKSVDISGLKFPVTIVFVGGYDPMKDWQKRYYNGLKKHGKGAYLVEYENAFHSFYSYPELPEFDMLMNEVKGFVQKQSAAFHM